MGMRPFVGFVGCFWLGMALGGCDCCRTKGNNTWNNNQPVFPPSSQTTQQGLTQGGPVQSATGAGTGAGANPNPFGSTGNTGGGFTGAGAGTSNPIAASSGGSIGLNSGSGSATGGIQRTSFQDTSMSYGGTASGSASMRETAPPAVSTPSLPNRPSYDIPPSPTGLPKSGATDSSLSSLPSSGYDRMGGKTGAPVETRDMSGLGSGSSISGSGASTIADSSLKSTPPAFSKSPVSPPATGMSGTSSSDTSSLMGGSSSIGGSSSTVLPTSTVGSGSGSSALKGNSSIVGGNSSTYPSGSGSSGSSPSSGGSGSTGSGLPGFGQ